MSRTPPIPPDQRSAANDKAHIRGRHMSHHDEKIGLESGQPGNARANLREQGPEGNLRQNLTHKDRRGDR
jgi:hypothetical protein